MKWAGGKRRLFEQFRPLLPRSFGAYFEPFVGGGALFFALGRKPAFLSDVNKELIDCYLAVRDDVEAVVEELGKHVHSETHYYRVRTQDPAALTLPARAARTIYLNKTGFNGLYRVNQSGQFNVPFGRYAKPRYCNPDNLRACSRALRGAHLAVHDFEESVASVKRGDFVYLDPPYVPLSDTADFTSYVPGGFGMREQERLADTVAKLADKGAYVMLSNSDTEAVRKLYKGFRIDVVLASRAINSVVSRRGKVGEVVVRSYGSSKRR